MPFPWRRRCLLAAIVWIAACTTPEERVAEHLENGAKFAAEGNSSDSILEYRSALKLDPQNAEVNFRLAEALENEGEPDAALYFRDAYRLDPTRIDAAVRAARLLALRDSDAAVSLINDARMRAPTDASVHAAQSELYLIRGNSRGAVSSARQAVAFDAEDWANWFQLGKAHQARIRERKLRKRRQRDRDFERAIDAFEHADERYGGLAAAWIEMGRVYGGWRGHRRQAQDAFRQAMAIATDAGNRNNRLAVAIRATEYALREGNDDDFLRWALRETVSAAPDHFGAWTRLAELEEETNGKGTAVVEELIGRRPDDVYAHLVFTSFLLSNGQATRAASHLRKLIREGPTAPELWEQLARIQIQRGKLAKARATYVSLVERYADDPVTRRTHARLAYAAGRHAEASRLLRSLESQQDEPEVQRLIARAELAQGNLQNAAAAIERAMPSEGPPAAETLRLKAHIHHDAEEWTQAVEAYSEMRVRRIRFLPIDRVRLARSLYESGKEDAARTMLERLLDAPFEAPSEAAVEYAHREGRERPDKAREYLKQALGRDPGDADVLEALTQLDWADGRDRAAMGRLNRAVDSGAATPRTLLLRAQAASRARDWKAAEADALRAFEAEPDLEGAADLLFGIYAASGSLMRAQKSFEEAEAAGVLHAGAQQLLARLYLHHGETAKARAVLEKVVEERPDMLRARNDLAYLLAEEGEKLDWALELAEKVQQSWNRDASTADTVGFVYLRKGLHEAALQQFEYAIELSDDDSRPATRNLRPLFHYHLGLALSALDRQREAAAAFERALAIDAHFAHADEARQQLESSRKAGAARRS